MIKLKILQLLNFFYPLLKKWMGFTVYAYLVLGAFNTLLNIFLFICCFWVLQDSYTITNAAVEIATIVSFVITVLSGFWLNKNFAFTKASNELNEVKKQFGKYFLVALQGQFSDYLITKGLIIFLKTNPAIAYCISTFLMLVFTYFLQKYFTFKSR